MKICIVKLSAMGDIIHTMVALQFIKKKLPNCQIDWIVEESFKGILENNPHIDNILPINLKSVKTKYINIFKQIGILNEYSKNNYDYVIDAQGLIKSAIVSKIVGHKIIGSRIVGFDEKSIREKFASNFYDGTVTIGYEKNVIDRNIKVLCDPFDINVSKKDLFDKEIFLYTTTHPKKELELTSNKIIFVVGASKPNKVYPKENFLEVATKLEENIIVVWGNEDERVVAQYLDDNCTNVTISKKLTLNELKTTIKNAKLLIGGDTGPTHMAWALNVPSITIFGNTPEYRNTYITDINKVIKSNSIVNPLKLDKYDFSIKDIEPTKIVDMAKELVS